MKLNDNTEIIIGPPGTGKTATLIAMAKELVESGVDPSQIGYISFTRQAVREASQRIIAATGHDSEKFIGFKTLHSMAFWLLGKKHGDITNSYDVEDISFLPKHVKNPIAKERTKVYAQLYGYHVVTGCPITEVWGRYAGRESGTEEDFFEWVVLYQEHKKRLNKIDFHDLIKEFVDHGIRFPFQYLFIDEAQDFSPDQWAAAAILARNAGRLIIAGDSDQAVYGWAGSNASIFDVVEGHRRVLDQSFRLPKRPYILAHRILGAMARETLYKPTDKDGQVRHIFESELSELPLENGEKWFILCRNNYHVKKIEHYLIARRVRFSHIQGSRGDGFVGKLISRIKWYNEWVATGTATPRRKRLLSNEGSNVEASATSGRKWYEAFDGWPVDRVSYFRELEGQWDSANIFIGTFHASKGAESPNVVVYGDCTRRISEAYNNNSVEELRALYVALTRTSNRLYLVQSTGRYGIPWHHFTKLPEDLTNGIL